MKIYTRTGDKGKTSLLRGGRVDKHHPRVAAYGNLDELNCWLGYILANCEDKKVCEILINLQYDLFVLCSDVAALYDPLKESPKVPRISADEVDKLEEDIDNYEKDLPVLKNFILPGGSITGAGLHYARTICRRAERNLTEVNELEGQINPEAMKYVNRLSDYLFTFARWANHRAKHPEDKWITRKK